MSTIARPVSRRSAFDQGREAIDGIGLQRTNDVLVDVAVTRVDAWASRSLTTLMSTPASSSIDALLCRASWNRMTGSPIRRVICVARTRDSTTVMLVNDPTSCGTSP